MLQNSTFLVRYSAVPNCLCNTLGLRFSGYASELEFFMLLNKKCLAAIAILSVCSMLTLSAQQEQKETKPSNGTPTIHVQVDMVSLPVVVTANDGSHIKDLKKEDFQLFENGIPQEIAAFDSVEAPISVALTLDTSGSTEFQLSRIKNDAMRFINLLRPDDSIAVVSFADEVTLIEPFSLYHKKNPDVLRKLKPGSMSAVYEAVWLSLEQVLKLEFGRKALVLLSDGVDNRSESVTWQETLDLAKKTEATIYCIYFNTEKDRGKSLPRGIDPMMSRLSQSLLANQWPRIPMPRPGGSHPEYTAGKEYLMDLARLSGGLFVDASKAENIGSAFRKIAEELWNQYSIGYYPKNLKHDKKFREVTIKINRPGLTVRSKPGYYDF
jgi:Ca-activated chloride channel family protein